VTTALDSRVIRQPAEAALAWLSARRADFALGDDALAPDGPLIHGGELTGGEPATALLDGGRPDSWTEDGRAAGPP
jgi:hypothetical protein